MKILLRLGNRLMSDTLYRNSLALMVNTAVLSGLGFAFWTLATHAVSAADVGVVTASISACTLLATAGTLGLTNSLIRFQPERSDRSFQMCLTSVLATQVASIVVLVITWWSPLRLPLASGLSWTATGAGIVLLQLTSLGMILDASTMAARRAPVILVKNTVGGIVRLGLLLTPVVLPFHPVVRLALIQVFGALASVLISVVALRRSVLEGVRRPSLRSLAGLWRFTFANHAAMMVGILPLTLSPLVVLHLRSSSDAAYFGVALMLLGLLSVIPSATAQSLFAESGHGEGTTGRVVQAGRSIFVLLVPAVVATCALAPLVLSVFGHDYVAAAPTLRWMALGTLPAAVNYLMDADVNGRGDGWGYLFLNVQNFILVLALVVVGSRNSLSAVGLGWCVGQALAAVVAVLYAVISRRRSVPFAPRHAGVGRRDAPADAGERPQTRSGSLPPAEPGGTFVPAQAHVLPDLEPCDQLSTVN